MNSIEDIRIFMGGDNNEIPIYPQAIDHLQCLIENCKKYNIEEPEIFPWTGGDGVQAEWGYKNDWYIEIDSSSDGISGLFVWNNDYDNKIECDFDDIKDAFLLVRIFLQNVVKDNASS